MIGLFSMDKSLPLSAPDIDIINYPFGHSSPKPRSGSVPPLIEEACSPILIVNAWKTAAVPLTARDIVTSGIKNHAEVTQAVTVLAIETAISQWAGKRTLALGGDHSQGFATVKATLLVHVAKAIISGDIPIQGAMPSAAIGELRSLAEDGRWENVAASVDRLVGVGSVVQKDIDKVIDRFTVIWVDAHGDFNTEDSSDTKNFHGMSLSAACGLPAGGIENIFGAAIRMNPANIHLVGARDLDEAEENLIRQHGVKFMDYDMHDLYDPKIRPEGMEKGTKLESIIKNIMDAADKVILSVDIDHLDHTHAPGTGTALKLPDRPNRFGHAPPGVSLPDSLAAFFGIIHHPKVVAVDLTEPGYATGSKEAPACDGLQTIATTIAKLVNIMGFRQDMTERILDGNRQRLLAAVKRLVYS